MKKVFAINGGAGRVICALPALEKYYKLNGDNFYILAESGLDFFLGNKNLQNLAFDPSTKGLFENVIKPNDLVTPEPYREHGYYNQIRSLTESFDFLINGSTDHSDLAKPKIYLSKTEELNALDAINRAMAEFKKKKTIVIQPFGRSSAAVAENSIIMDTSSRSLNKETYLKICQSLSKDYNLIYFGEHMLPDDVNTFKVQTNLRQWAAIIEVADYFIGCDSVGQHMAYSFEKPGTVILGSTVEKNITYSNHFQIIKKPNTSVMYNPIRISTVDGDLADRYNDTCMDFSEKETKDLIELIRQDIRKKI